MELEFQLSSLIGRSKTESEVNLVMYLVDKAGLDSETVNFLRLAAIHRIKFLEQEKRDWDGTLTNLSVLIQLSEVERPVIEPSGHE